MSVLNLDDLKAFDMKAKQELSVLLSMKIIPTDATDTQLIEEFKNMNLGSHNSMLVDAFNRLPNKVQTGLLHLIASLNFQSKGQTGGDNGDTTEIARIDKKPNIYLTKNLVYSVLGLFFGLFLLHVAINMATSLGDEYGIEITFAGFIGSFLTPLSSAKDAVPKILASLAEYSQEEISNQVSRVCGAAGGGWVANAVVFIQGAELQLDCALTATNNVIGLEKLKVTNNIRTIINIARAGYSIACYSGAKTVLALEGPNRRISALIKNIPGGNKALQLLGAGQDHRQANENRGGKRKSKKARKGRKSKKSRKA